LRTSDRLDEPFLQDLTDQAPRRSDRGKSKYLAEPQINSTYEGGDALIDYTLIEAVFFRQALIGVPAHPLRLGWQLPFTRIEVANQSGFDLLPRADGSVELCLELCGVGHLLPPGLAAAKAAR